MKNKAVVQFLDWPLGPSIVQGNWAIENSRGTTSLYYRNLLISTFPHDAGSVLVQSLSLVDDCQYEYNTQNAINRVIQLIKRTYNTKESTK